MSEQTLDFITLRPPEPLGERARRVRHITDLRAKAPYRDRLVAARSLRAKIALAVGWLGSSAAFTPALAYDLGYEELARVLREHLRGPVEQRDGGTRRGSDRAALVRRLEDVAPVLGTAGFFTDPALDPKEVGFLYLQYAAVWNSLYALTVLAGVTGQRTNHVVDAIRVQHVLAALRATSIQQSPPERWPYHDLDDYEVVVAPEVVTHDRLID